jgi:hypothetical protein
VDWGLAKPFARSEAERASGEQTLAPRLGGSSAGATQVGQAVGTPAYMSPEQAEGRWDLVGPASDLCSLGATLYALLTGQAPFQGSTPQEVLAKARRGDFPPPRSVKRSVPAALEAVCLKAMALRPEDRYKTALELAAEVEYWLADEPVAAYREPWLVRLGRWRKRYRTQVTGVVAAVLVALLLGGGGWLWWQWDRQARRDETARGINLALGKAEQLRDQARQLVPADLVGAERTLVLWQQALAAVEHAEGVRVAGLADEATRQRLVELRGEVQAAIAAAEKTLAQRRKEVKLLADLERADLLAASSREGKWAHRAAAAAYAQAFVDYGLIVRASSPAAVARWLKRSPATIVEPVLLALNNWALDADPGKDRQLLRQVLRRVDPDLWRRRLRAALEERDPPSLRELAVEAKGKRFPPEPCTS